MVGEYSCKQYVHNKDFDENTIGCGIRNEFIGKEGEERLIHNFCGEMSALHFVEINSKTAFLIHNLLNKIYLIVDMFELFPLIAYGASFYENCTELQSAISYKELTESGFIEHQFLIINPKYATKWSRENEKIYYKKIGKHSIEINNQVERVYPQTKILHNAPAREVFSTIQGISAIMPLLYELSEFNSNPDWNLYKYLYIPLILLLVTQFSTKFLK